MTSKNPLYGLDVRAVVLVGGRDFGRCPLAAHLPTALWPLVDKPVLGRLLDHLAAAGLRCVSVCCAQEDSEAVGAVCREAPLETALVVEQLTAGTAGCLRDAVAADPGDLILVFSASMLVPPSIGELVEAHRASEADLTMVFNPGRSPDTAHGPPAEIYLCRPGVLSHISGGGYSDIKEGLIPSLLRAGGTIRPLVLSQDVGNFHSRAGYLDALGVFFQNGAGNSLKGSSRSWCGEDPVFEGAGVFVHPSARVCGPALLGDHARILERAVVIGPAVIGRQAVLGEGSVLVRSALWAGAVVGTECEIRDGIVDSHVTVPDRTEIVETTASPSLSHQGPGNRLLGLGQSDGGRRRELLQSVVGRLGATWPGRTPLSPRHLGYAVGGLAVLAAFLWSYWPTISDLLQVWKRSDEYSAGLLVPFLAASILWSRRQQIGSTTPQPALFFGIGAFLLAQAVRGAGLYFLYSSAERLSLILSITALVLLLFGWRYLGKLATILLFLCLMLPWPNRVQSAVTLPLQKWSTTSAVFCLELAGYDVVQDGNVIHIGSSSVAVAEACNGLRMIMAFFVISGLVVLLVERPWWDKLIVLASSLPIAFLCNTLRLAVTAVFFTLITGEAWEQRFHDWGGYAMMPLALALVVGELWFLARLITPPLALEPAIISRRQTQQVQDP